MQTQPTKTVHREYVTTSPTTTGYVVQPHVTHVVEPRVTYVQEPRTYIEYVPQVTYVAQERTTYETVPRTEYETKSYATYDVQPIVEQKQVLIEQEVPIYYHGATEQVVYGQTQYYAPYTSQCVYGYSAQPCFTSSCVALAPSVYPALQQPMLAPSVQSGVFPSHNSSLVRIPFHSASDSRSTVNCSSRVPSAPQDIVQPIGVRL